jgi:hypothetical protein
MSELLSSRRRLLMGATAMGAVAALTRNVAFAAALPDASPALNYFVPNPMG